MKRRLLVITLTLVLSLLLFDTAFAANGPTEKGTGYISIFEPWDGGHREIDFNAHEGNAHKQAKGAMADYVFGPDGAMRRVFLYDVRYARVEGDYVHFGALCTFDSNGTHAGRWLYVKAHDGGTPGAGVDHIGWMWGSVADIQNWVNNGGPTGWWRPALSGNLVAHTYGE